MVYFNCGFLLILTRFIVAYTHYLDNRGGRRISFPVDEEHNEVGSNQCIAYNRKLGTCIPINLCPVLKRTSNFETLRRSLCGFSGSKPKVCCPLSSGTSRKPTTPTKPPTRKPDMTRRITVPEPSKPTGQPTSTSLTLQPDKFPAECGRSNSTSSKVVGGQPAEPGAWPWMAALFVDEGGIKSSQCGATLVSWDIVLTAAHCVVEGGKNKDPATLTIRLGEHNIERDVKEDAILDIPVQSVVSHEHFEPRSYLNDIAIIKLAKKVEFSERVSPACLPFDSDLFKSGNIVGRPAIVTGWGRTSFNGPSSDVLLEAQLKIVDQDECRKVFNKLVNITKVYLCAGVSGSTKDSCQGDSGGPLVSVDKGKYYLAGIVSFGRRCATPGFPGVYTRITEFLDWIQKHI